MMSWDIPGQSVVVLDIPPSSYVINPNPTILVFQISMNVQLISMSVFVKVLVTVSILRDRIFVHVT